MRARASDSDCNSESESEREHDRERETDKQTDGQRERGGRERQKEETFFRKGLGLDNILEEAKDNHHRNQVLELERVVDDLCSRAHHLESVVSIRGLLSTHTKQIKIEESICAGALRISCVHICRLPHTEKVFSRTKNRNLPCVCVSPVATKKQKRTMWA